MNKKALLYRNQYQKQVILLNKKINQSVKEGILNNYSEMLIKYKVIIVKNNNQNQRKSVKPVDKWLKLNDGLLLYIY